MYFRLQAEPGLRSGYLRQQNNKHETLLLGSFVDEADLESPWRYTASVNKTHGLALSDYYPGARVMSNRLIDTLRASGVDNLQTFPAEITNGLTGEIIRDFSVVNIVGMTSAADLTGSVALPVADVQHFERLRIDPTRAKGLLMFRLAESRRDVIVADNVAEAIRAGSFTDLALEPLEE